MTSRIVLTNKSPTCLINSNQFVSCISNKAAFVISGSWLNFNVINICYKHCISPKYKGVNRQNDKLLINKPNLFISSFS